MALSSPLGACLGLLPLTPGDPLVCIGLGLALFSAVEVEKLFLRSRTAEGRRLAAQS